MAFISPIVQTHRKGCDMLRHVPTRTYLSAHPVYDVVNVSTYIGFFLLQYWQGEERRDVKLFAVLMAMVWNFTRDYDMTIFVFLWVMGAVSEFVSKGFLAGGNQEEADKFHVGVQLGGFMSFLLLVFDALDIATGH